MTDAKKQNKKPEGKKLEIADSDTVERVYSNYVSVTTAPHECNLTFCHIDPLAISATKVEAKVVAKVALPNTFVEEVLRVIEVNYTKVMKKMKETTPKK